MGEGERRRRKTHKRGVVGHREELTFYYLILRSPWIFYARACLKVWALVWGGGAVGGQGRSEPALK